MATSANLFIADFFLIMGMIMNLFFSLDVMLIITYPFASSERRLKYYVPPAIMGSLFIVISG